MTILSEAESIITGDRNSTHGPPERNFATIAGYWSTYLGRPITAADVAKMMVLMKVARSHTGSGYFRDHYVDMAGYAALAWEMESCSASDAMERGS